jgi:hypothetical protein
MEGDWVLVYDNSLDNQHRAARKFSRRWFGPYVVKKVEDTATYRLTELDSTPLALRLPEKELRSLNRDRD